MSGNQLKSKIFSVFMSLDVYISALDKYLDKRKKSEMYIFYLLPILVFGYLSFEMLTPMASENLKTTENQLRTIEAQIESFKSSVNTGRDGKSLIEILRERNQDLKQEMAKVEDRKYYIESKIEEELNDIKYSKKNWSNYLHEVTRRATDNKVNIGTLSNSINKDISIDTFSKIIALDLNASGRFVGVMKFLDELERGDRLVEVTNLSMDGSRDVDFELHLDVWGVK